MSSFKLSCEIVHNVHLFDCYTLLFSFIEYFFFLRLWILPKSEQEWHFSSFGVFNFHSLPVFLIFHRSDLQRLISSSTHLSNPYLSFCLLPVLIPLALSFCFFIIPSHQLDFLLILALVLFRVSFSFIYLVFIDTAFSSPGSYFNQFMSKRRRFISRCVSFLPLLQISFKSKYQKLLG
jgi:hypothetical protein